MKKILFGLFQVINYCITLLPLRILYLFSDFFFLLLYYFPSYRRKVVDKNLRNSFPEKSDRELKLIARRYYRHMADLFVETLKVTHMSRRQLNRRIKIRDFSIIKKLIEDNRDILAVCSHYNNWEWLESVNFDPNYRILTIYKPLTSKNFDHFMLKLRSKFGATPVPMESILRSLVIYRKKNIRTISAFIADQTPPKEAHSYWTTFLNQDTPFYMGVEKVAKMLNMAVIFVHIIKVRRGFYEIELSLISENPAEEPDGVITERHVRELEKVIREKPEYWLWSHRRWKHKRPVNE